MKYLQAVFLEFNFVSALNKDTIIRYFWEDLWPSIQAQLDIRDRDLDSWDEFVDKTVDAEAKASLQAPSGTRKIDFWCPWGQQPTKKDDKDSKNFEKNKSF